MIKFNWGTGIFLFYTLFAIVLFTAVYRSTFRNNSLVTEKYYAADLKYQEHYNKLVNSQALSESVEIEKNSGGLIEMNFPKNFHNISGEILLFHPVNSDFDLKIPIALNDQNQQIIPTESLMKTRWRVKVDWQADGKPYYTEKQIRL